MTSNEIQIPEPQLPPVVEEDPQMTFFQHLGELRSRLLRSIVGLVPAVAIGWVFKKEIKDFLVAPLQPAWEKLELPGQAVLRFSGPADAFMMYMKNSLIAGVLLASPWIFWQLWMFIAPGLYKKEKALAIPFIVASTLCFVGGAVFGYKLVFPEAFTVLLGFSDETLVATLFVKDYMPFFRRMLLAFGIVFEVPVIVTFLAGAGIVTWQQLLKFSRWWIVCASFISMLLTPQDVYTMVMMLIPLVLLYFVGVGCAYLISVFQKKPSP
ncbi:MAG: twin-arginine translocase subunit TatC [Deltaproteobacteria bacterium]|nr:MAG: twin-arginine translocase subunit TatC [Deltaproteobacteria bacterium]